MSSGEGQMTGFGFMRIIHVSCCLGRDDPPKLWHAHQYFGSVAFNVSACSTTFCLRLRGRSEPEFHQFDRAEGQTDPAKARRGA